MGWVGLGWVGLELELGWVGVGLELGWSWIGVWVGLVLGGLGAGGASSHTHTHPLMTASTPVCLKPQFGHNNHAESTTISTK